MKTLLNSKEKTCVLKWDLHAKTRFCMRYQNRWKKIVSYSMMSQLLRYSNSFTWREVTLKHTTQSLIINHLSINISFYRCMLSQSKARVVLSLYFQQRVIILFKIVHLSIRVIICCLVHVCFIIQCQWSE